jgi:hypothetical protein
MWPTADGKFRQNIEDQRTDVLRAAPIHAGCRRFRPRKGPLDYTLYSEPFGTETVELSNCKSSFFGDAYSFRWQQNLQQPGVEDAEVFHQ